MLRRWDRLPQYMQTESVRRYYEPLRKKWVSLCLKKCFDIVASFLGIILLSPVFAVLAVWIKADSRGPVMFRQTRITRYGKPFRIYKFRTMVADAPSRGAQVTVQGDSRITKVGAKLRGCRLDELPQLFNILRGEMSFVGVRPEVPRYVEQYSEEMYATLLMPAGVTSQASILYKDEQTLLDGVEDPDRVYVETVLPGKMKYNLEQLRDFSFLRDLQTMFRTVAAVLGRDGDAPSDAPAPGGGE